MPTANHYYKFLLLLTAVFICTVSTAQQNNFIHIQSATNQPFTVQFDGNAYSSSGTGYIVIPQVPVGEHTLVIGFPRNLYPEYSFHCTVADKPRGFSLKQAVDNSWSLFDMVNFTVIRGTVASKEPLVQEPVTKPVEMVIQKPTENIPAKSLEEPVVKRDKSAATVSRIKKIFDKASVSGIDQVYIVINRGKADTVALFIPVLETPKPGASIIKLAHGGRNQGADTGETTAILSQILRQTLLSK